MKRRKEIEINVCENCGKEEQYAKECMGCDKAFCYDCKCSYGKEFSILVYGGCSADGYFCNKCISEPPNMRAKELLEAYLVVDRQRLEIKWLSDNIDSITKNNSGTQKINEVRKKYGLSVW